MMKQVIVIATTPNRYRWLANCLETLKGYDKYPLMVISDFNWELGKIRFVYENTNIDEFFLLHDSCEVKDPSLFDLVFEKHRGESVAFSDHPVVFGMYLGKYRREILEKMDIPIVRDKKGAIYWEEKFNIDYVQLDPATVLLFDDFRHTTIFEEKLGRKNMKVENEYLVKWKGTWGVIK